MPRWLKVVIAILVPLAIGGVAGGATAEAIPNWYTTLNQPSFNPPNWIFGPVWTTLYILMGVSFAAIWLLPKSKKRNQAMLIFGVQLALNFAWSFLFFYFNRIDLALIEIMVLWIAIAWMIRSFYALKKWTGWINVPYLLWVSFALILNAAYFTLN